MLRVVVGGAPARARSAARCPAGALAEAGVPGRPGTLANVTGPRAAGGGAP